MCRFIFLLFTHPKRLRGLTAGAFALLLASMPAHANQPTNISSDALSLETKDTQNHFHFLGNVRIVAENLDVTCDRLEVIAERTQTDETETEEGSSSTATGAVAADKIGAIQRIIAEGAVTVKQEGRVATANRAEVLPTEGKIMLLGSVELTDAQGTLRGERLTLLKDSGQILIEGDSERTRPQVTLPAMPNLGFGKDADKASE